MRAPVVHLIPFAIAALIGGMVIATPANAQTRAVHQEVCVSVDEAHDTLAPPERAAARLLLARQFELEGWVVVPDACLTPYTVGHIQLGNTITVTVSGPNGHWTGTALGLGDLRALYSQIVRSIVTGLSMTGMHVIDRTNVTAAQALPPRRVSSDSFAYARLGYGGHGPGLGIGYRAELDSFALDVSLVNYQMSWASTPYLYSVGSSAEAAWSWVKLEGLRFKDPVANAGAYFGAGLSWGGAYSSGGLGQTSWQGSGLQGEVTAGYEIGRASTLRVFVQADGQLPFYQMRSRTGRQQYSPSFIVSVGLGWQHGHR
jgi:hypothetical protein